MSFLDRFFGRTKPAARQEPPLAPDFEALRASALALFASIGTPAGRIGGLPSLPVDLAWPYSRGRPLAFLCELDLGHVPPGFDRHGLPERGVLYFFYNPDLEAWGYDPSDKGCWQVLYAARPGESQCPAPPDLAPELIYVEKLVDFQQVRNYPSSHDNRVAGLHLSSSQLDQYDDLCQSVYAGQPAHHLFGHAEPEQSADMDLECQYVSHGLQLGDGSAQRDPRARALAAGRSEWLLLLQLDTDGQAGMVWGDCGKLYFWIRQTDLAAGRFDACWMMMQCG